MRWPKEINTESIRLDKNECICPSFIRRLLKISNITEYDYTKYCSTLDIEQKLGEFFNCRYPSSQIYVDNGSEQVLKSLIASLNCNKWITTAPTFEMFPVYCKLYNKKIETIPFNFFNKKFSINLLNNNFQDSGLYIVSPHNPTGYTLSLQDIKDLSEKYVYVIIDQAYLTPIDKIDIETLPFNVIVVRTFSKMGGLTGMRFGFCITKNTSIVDKLNLLRPMYLNSVTIKLVEGILKTPDVINDIQKEFNMVKNLINLPTIAQAGNFILISGISEYKKYKLKEYTFNENKFYRMTLMDTETYYKL